MRRQHGRGIDHGVALERRLFLLRDVDPGRRQAEGRLGGVNAGQVHLRAGRVHDHVLARPDLAGAGVDFLDLDDVGVGLELHVVEDAHRRHHEAHLDRKRAAQRLDLLGQPVAAVRRVDQRQQRVAELDLEIVDLERGGDRLVRRGGQFFGRGRPGLRGGGRPCGACRMSRRARPRRRRAAGTAASGCPAGAPSPASPRTTGRAPWDSRRAAPSAPCRRRR